MRGINKWVAATVGILLLVLAAIPAYGINLNTDGPRPGATTDDYVFVRFGDAPLASYDGSVSGYEATKPGKGQKLDLNSPAARKYGNRLAAQRQNYLKWLAKRYPQVQIVTEYAVTFNGVGLKLNGATLRDVQGGPGAVQAGLSASFGKAMSASHGVIGTPALWSALGGQESAGSGIKVGVIDSGVDQSHPFLHDAGMTAPAGYPMGDARFTSNKVIVAKVFHQSPWLTAEAIDSHGTHVAGTIAGRAGTAAPLATGLSGVAPGAWLGNYNVFPGHVASAKSLFIAKAVEEAVIDGMDVLNLSLGGTAHQGSDILSMAVDAAVDAGVVVAIAAGNEGPGHYTVGSPGIADKVITVAAVTNAHVFAPTVYAAALPGPVLARTGDGNGELRETKTGTYAVWADFAGGDTLACTPLSGTPLTGMIALLQRGVCTFAEKVNNAAAAGAVAVIMYQREDVDGEPIAMSTDGVTIPAVMIRRDDGKAMAAWTGDRTVTLEKTAERAGVASNLADFSSWGPTPAYMLKPDVAAIGTDVYSSVPGGGYAVFGGTSMATPHVAGASALLLAHSRANGRGWGPAEVKAALMGTARPGASTDDPLKVGAGMIDLARAVSPPAMAMPSSLSFGLVRPVGSHLYQMSFRLTNTSGAAAVFAMSDSLGGKVTVSPGSVALAAGQSALVTVTVADRGAPSPGQGGYPELRRGRVVAEAPGVGSIRVPYLYVMDYNR
ncbi:MAG TPA: S8 family serine peptidase [Symbiobacteriaceae bacterium]|nr:S8 family serine peptidase [Symbiobacteriaceae bacterium]